jgi:hypothetical protein
MRSKVHPRKSNKRERQEHATEVEFVVVKNRRLGKKVKAVPVVREASPVKNASSSRLAHTPIQKPQSRQSSHEPTMFEDNSSPKPRKGKVRILCISVLADLTCEKETA